MKVLSLWQPWCSLCVIINPATGEPYKTIETRSWKPPAWLIGQRIALHAAMRVVFGEVGDLYCETYFSNVQHIPDRCYCDEESIGPPCDRGATRTPCLTRDGAEPILLPVGAIVATCTLVDVVPIYGPFGESGVPTAVRVGGPWGADDSPGRAAIQGPDGIQRVDGQLPYGLFIPGRWAWLLADVVPVDPPQPFKGGQGLTKSWEPAAA